MTWQWVTGWIEDRTTWHTLPINPQIHDDWRASQAAAQVPDDIDLDGLIDRLRSLYPWMRP